jgi:aryl-alcohol dehydrogenase-like predicted oxidoreductase
MTAASSRLMLGTVQFGLAYGIANSDGKPAYRTVRAILGTALEGGIRAFDTAAAYGDSEAVLGRALRELGAAGDVLVATKVRPLTDAERAEPAQAARAIEQSVDTSRRALGLDRLPVVLFHRERDAVHMDVLRDLARRGWIERAGVSLGADRNAALTCASDMRVEAAQIPCNLFDPRHVRSGMLAAAARRGVTVCARSVYLQGLMLMPEEQVPDFLRGVLPVRRAVETIAAASGLGMAELAMRYVLSLDGIRYVLTGIDTPEQLRENLRIAEAGPLDRAILAAVDAAVPDLPELLLVPPLWEPYKRAGLAPNPAPSG